MAPRVVLADNLPLVITATRHFLEQSGKVASVETAENWEEMLHLATGAAYDVLVMEMPLSMDKGPHDASIADAIRQLVSCIAGRPVMIYTAVENGRLLGEMLGAGVKALVSKKDPAEELLIAIDTVTAGGIYMSPAILKMMNSENIILWQREPLSPRESEILTHLAAGKKVGEIATLLGRSPKTVSCQKNKAMQKLGLKNDFDIYALFGSDQAT